MSFTNLALGWLVLSDLEEDFKDSKKRDLSKRLDHLEGMTESLENWLQGEILNLENLNENYSKKEKVEYEDILKKALKENNLIYIKACKNIEGKILRNSDHSDIKDKLCILEEKFEQGMFQLNQKLIPYANQKNFPFATPLILSPRAQENFQKEQEKKAQERAEIEKKRRQQRLAIIDAGVVKGEDLFLSLLMTGGSIFICGFITLLLMTASQVSLEEIYLKPEFILWFSSCAFAFYQILMSLGMGIYDRCKQRKGSSGHHRKRTLRASIAIVTGFFFSWGLLLCSTLLETLLK
jgi:hypothetical protein